VIAKRKQSADVERALEYLKDFKERPEPHETQSQHLARRDHHSAAPEGPDFAADTSSCIGR